MITNRRKRYYQLLKRYQELTSQFSADMLYYDYADKKEYEDIKSELLIMLEIMLYELTVCNVRIAGSLAHSHKLEYLISKISLGEYIEEADYADSYFERSFMGLSRKQFSIGLVVAICVAILWQYWPLLSSHRDTTTAYWDSKVNYTVSETEKFEVISDTCSTADVAVSRIYECDYKSLNLNTEITTILNDTEISISGNIFRLLTDPLTANDAAGNILGYAGDAYGIIEQDDHGIYIGDVFDINMCGNFDMLGNSYELKDADGNIVATADFNAWNTSGSITDINGNLVATYSRSLMLNDYTVTIYDNDICSDLTVLMIMASYVSDYMADSED